MSYFLSDEELEQLRGHGIVIFADRVIFDAQPPMTAAQMASVQTHCAGAIPPELTALWQRTAGGRIDYDLTLRMRGNEEAIHWGELFFNGDAPRSSERAHDLQGWITHEQQLAEQGADGGGRPWHGALVHLPFGGFEDTDRIYAVVEPGVHYGQILAWKQGLPLPWTHALHQDGLTAIAPDLQAAFAALHLEEDPLAPAGDYFTGQALLAYLDDRHEEHGLDLDLSDKLTAFYRQAMVDWRDPLSAGTLAADGPLARTALRHAIATDDAALIEQLAEAGVSLDQSLEGSAIATELALGEMAHHAAMALIGAGARVTPGAFGNVDDAMPPELTTALLARGAQPTAAAVAKCVACGAPDSARLIAQACAQSPSDLSAAYEAARNALLVDLEAALTAVGSGERSHYLGPEGLIRRIDRLRSFVL